jgi:hypothetical protein
MSDADVDGVDAWIAGYKELDGFQPPWLPAKGRSEWKADWPIRDANDLTSGKLILECDAMHEEISVSIVVRKASIYRLDWVPDDRQEGNPYPARRYAPHLPVDFLGTHVHAWADHREYVRATGLKGFDLPFRCPTTAPTSLDEALERVTGAMNVAFPSSKRGTTLPPQTGLKLKWRKG